MPDYAQIVGLGGRPVQVSGIGLFCPAGIGIDGSQGGAPGPVPGFRARNFISDRKSIKIMSRAVQLGVSAAAVAAEDDGSILQVAPERRGMFVAARSQSGDPQDLARAFDRSWGANNQFDLNRFAREGIERIHPLWLVKGLSNNVLGLTSVALDIQGWNSNYCQGEEGSWTAIMEGAYAVAEGRADWVLAGGADSLVGAEEVLGVSACGEGAAFFVFRAGRGSGPECHLDRQHLSLEPERLGVLGAASWAVALARSLIKSTDE